MYKKERYNYYKITVSLNWLKLYSTHTYHVYVNVAGTANMLYIKKKQIDR